MIEKVQQMVQDRRLTLRLIAEELAIVPHKLTDEQKAKRMKTSGDFISMYDQYPLLLENIVTRNETWCYQIEP